MRKKKLPSRYRPDDLRRLGVALATGLGVEPARAAAWIGQRLWYDVAGFPALGFATLLDDFERIEAGLLDPRAEGVLRGEHAAIAALEGRGGIPDLDLARAANLAIEKARDVGVGLVRITGLAGARPGASVVAEMAIGPEVAVVLGPGSSFAYAIPSAQGLPILYDSALMGADRGQSGAGRSFETPWFFLVPDGGWLVIAVSVIATESLSSFHERVATTYTTGQRASVELTAEQFERMRIEARERGLPLEAKVMDRFRLRARVTGAPVPEPWAG